MARVAYWVGLGRHYRAGSLRAMVRRRAGGIARPSWAAKLAGRRSSAARGTLNVLGWHGTAGSSEAKVQSDRGNASFKRAAMRVQRDSGRSLGSTA